MARPLPPPPPLLMARQFREEFFLLLPIQVTCSLDFPLFFSLSCEKRPNNFRFYYSRDSWRMGGNELQNLCQYFMTFHKKYSKM